jgi:hypothetical protein
VSTRRITPPKNDSHRPMGGCPSNPPSKLIATIQPDALALRLNQCRCLSSRKQYDADCVAHPNGGQLPSRDDRIDGRISDPPSDWSIHLDADANARFEVEESHLDGDQSAQGLCTSPIELRSL